MPDLPAGSILVDLSLYSAGFPGGNAGSILVDLSLYFLSSPVSNARSLFLSSQSSKLSGIARRS